MRGATTARALAWSGVALIAGCAANSVTLRSNHYRLHVPPGWHVVEEGGGPELPTLIRVPVPDEYAPSVEIRIYPWPVQGPVADPAGDVLVRLAQAGVLDLAAARADDDPCPDRPAEYVVFGRPARAIHLKNLEGQRIVVTGGHQDGSLVGVVALVTAGQSSCADADAMASATTSLVAGLASGGDATRPHRPPTLVSDQGVPLPPVDPNAPP